MSDNLSPNLADAKLFLETLDTDQTRFSFRTIDDNKQRRDNFLSKNIYDSFENALPILEDKQNQGASIFALVHFTNGAGCKKENIVYPRAVYVDDDKPRSSPRTDFPIEPTISVETSPGKYHYYWMLSDPQEMGFGLFEGVLRRLVKEWGHDKNACKITQIMRLPGFYHLKKEPFLSHIVDHSDKRYSVDEILKAFPPFDPPDLTQDNQENDQYSILPDHRWTKEKIREAIKYIPDKYINERDFWINCGAALNHQFGDDGLELFDYLSSLSVHYDYPELLKDFKSFTGKGKGKTKIGTLLHYARQNPEFISVEAEILENQTHLSEFKEYQKNNFLDEIRFFKDITFTSISNWLIKGILSRGDQSCLAGGSGIGKSFLAIDKAFSVARGYPYRGFRTTKTGVLYISLEGNRSFTNRLLAYKEAFETEDDIPFMLLPVAIDLHSSDKDAEKIIETHKMLQDRGEEVGLIFIDTLAQALAGGDENNSSDMGKLIKLVNKINEKTGAHICLVHHHGKEATKGLRGHSSLKAALDTVIEIEAINGLKIAKITKQKDGEEGLIFPFQLEQVSLGFDDDGDEITSCVIKHLEDVQTSHHRELSPQAQKTFHIIQEMNSHSEVFESPNEQIKLSRNDVLEAFIERQISSANTLDSKRKVFKRALENLHASNLIEYDKECIWLVKEDCPELSNAA